MAGNRNGRGLLPLALVLTLPPMATALPASAQAQSLYAGSLHAGSLEIPLNKSQVVTVDRPIARAMIGGPTEPDKQIADIVPITDRQIYVLGKKMGTTSLTLYDGGGRVISIMDVAVGPDVIALTDQLSQLVPGEKIDARISNEAIVLTGMVNSAGASDRAAQIACPTLVCAAESDPISAHAGELYAAITCPKQLLEFTEAEGAGDHCEQAAHALYNQRVFDWLDEVFAGEGKRG